MEAAPLSGQSTDSGAGVLIFSHSHNQFITPVDAGLVKDIRHMLFDCRSEEHTSELQSPS